MAGSRNYRRKSNGQFAAVGDPGTKMTTGRAGGFANATLRARVASSNKAARSAARRKALGKALLKKGVTAGVFTVAGTAYVNAAFKKSAAGDVSKMRAGVRTAANIAKGRSS